MTYFVSIACGWAGLGWGGGPVLGAGGGAPMTSLGVEAPGERTAAARGYVAAVGRRRAAQLRALGAPEPAIRAETDEGGLAGALVEVAYLRLRPGPGRPDESWCFLL